MNDLTQVIALSPGLGALEQGWAYNLTMARVRRRAMRQKVLQALRDFLQQGGEGSFGPIEGIHPADLADVMWLDMSPSESERVFRGLEPELAAEVLAEAEPTLASAVIEDMAPSELGSLLNFIPADDGADILELLPEERRLEVLSHVKPEDASNLRHLSAYDADSAGGMMTTEFVAELPGAKIGDIIKRIKRGDEEDAETINTIYVTDEDGMLDGVISARELLSASIHDEIGPIANPDVIQARVDEDQEEIARRLLHYNLSTIPVTDMRGLLVGIVTADDALEVLEEEGSEDALLLAGAHGESDAVESLWHRVTHRAPMLLITVFAGLVMARVMHRLIPGSAELGPDGSPDIWIIVLSYIPMVLALSGTVGTQTSAIIVRGFAVGQIEPGRRFKVFTGELQVGLLLGALTCVIAIPVATWFSGGNWDIGLSLGLSLLLAMTWAATAAASIAMGSEAIGLDPALVSGPLMMAVSDLSAVLLFFGVAQQLLS